MKWGGTTCCHSQTPLPFPNLPPSSDSNKEPAFNKQHPKEQRGQVLNPLSVLLLVASPGFQRTSPTSPREATLQRGLDQAGAIQGPCRVVPGRNSKGSVKATELLDIALHTSVSPELNHWSVTLPSYGITFPSRAHPAHRSQGSREAGCLETQPSAERGGR